MKAVTRPGAALLAVVVGGAAVLVAIAWRAGGDGVAAPAASGPQCGHWCVRRCCELLGAPVELREILTLLPPRPAGHSMLELAKVLTRIGFEVEGRRETVDSLAGGSFPCVAHLAKPDHFITISTIEHGRVHLFDGSGRRTSRSLRNFRSQWSGNVLYVRRPATEKAFPIYAATTEEAHARIQFQTLFIDTGEVGANRPESRQIFAYPFKNVGNADLEIEAIHKSCACIEGVLSKTRVGPGEEGEIKLVYELGRRAGPFFQEVLVECNDAVAPLVSLKAAGYIDAGVVVSPRLLDFGEVAAGRSATLHCFVSYSGACEDFTVGCIACDAPGIAIKDFRLADEAAVQRVWPRATHVSLTQAGTHVVEVALNASSLPIGDVDATVSARTDVRGFETLTIPVRARVVPAARGGL